MNASFYNGNESDIAYLKGIRDINIIEKHPTYENALKMYRRGREKLLDVNAWKHEINLRDFDYSLTDRHGTLKYGFACDGDYIRFKPEWESEEHCWTLVERILEVSHDDWMSFAMRLRPATPWMTGLNGTEHSNQNSGSTSTLIMERNGSKITAFVHERRMDTADSASGTGFLSRIFKMVSNDKAGANTNKHNWESLIDMIMDGIHLDNTNII